jgi:hypothetical protein
MLVATSHAQVADELVEVAAGSGRETEAMA